jgi:hypothetical protein
VAFIAVLIERAVAPILQVSCKTELGKKGTFNPSFRSPKKRDFADPGDMSAMPAVLNSERSGGHKVRDGESHGCSEQQVGECFEGCAHGG